MSQSDDLVSLHSPVPCQSQANVMPNYSVIRNRPNFHPQVDLFSCRAAATVFLLLLLLISFGQNVSGAKSNGFTNEWAVNIQGGEEVAKSVALRHGYVYKGEILPNYYLFAHDRLSKRSLRRSRREYLQLTGEPEVFQSASNLNVIFSRLPTTHLRLKRNGVRWVEQQRAKVRVKRDVHRLKLREILPNDPKWPEMWYLNRGNGLDMNVEEAWEEGYTGKGTVVTILDDGIEFTHPDLAENYDAQASYDLNANDRDPTPRYDMTNENKHGTRCAGEVAAHYNNSVCAVGIAFDAKIGGIRMLDGDVTDAVEAKALSFERDHIDIYSASWGPEDDGKTVDGPARLASLAFRQGVEKGRKGRGSIFVWASGNGGNNQDSCNCDGYTNSIYTLSIASASEEGNVPWYSEACSSTLATTYSSGNNNEKSIVTTDLHGGCTEAHTGTSASAPIAAAVCALTLQANPMLTWRDLQHIVVMTARPVNLRTNDWKTNGVGRNVSHNFGYGLIDAAAMVRTARNWTTVPTQHRCVVQFPTRFKNIPPRYRFQVTLDTDGCADRPDSRVVYLEHVQAKISLQTPRRGDIQIYLVSPSGTNSTLLTKRPRDVNRVGFRDWAFMTAHNWGEKAAGQWVLEITNDGYLATGESAQLQYWELILYGTDSPVGPNGGTNGVSNLKLSGGQRLISWIGTMIVPLAIVFLSL